jgi:hypothetical protein
MNWAGEVTPLYGSEGLPVSALLHLRKPDEMPYLQKKD